MECPRERSDVVEGFCQETAEDQLRAAPIRPGDSVIILNEVVLNICSMPVRQRLMQFRTSGVEPR